MQLATDAKDSTINGLVDQSIENTFNIFEKIDQKKLKYDCDVTITHNLGPVTIQCTMKSDNTYR